MLTRRIAVALLACVLPSVAVAQPAAPISEAPTAVDDPVTPPATRPSGRQDLQPMRVLQKPSSDEISRAYPRAALSKAIGGRGQVSCEVALSQRLERCRVIAEEPKGYGFGDAAMGLAARFRVAPPTIDGVAVQGARVTIPFGFRMRQGHETDRPPAGLATADSPAGTSHNVVAPTPSTPPHKPSPKPPLRAKGALWAPVSFAVLVLLSLILAAVAPSAVKRRRTVPGQYA